MRMRKLFAAVATGSLVATGMAVNTTAEAKTVKACVKKSDGELKVLNKKNKKCKKGWVKISWNNPGSLGPQGSTGPVGPDRVVVDKAGRTLGTYGGTYYGGLATLYYFVILQDGGVFTYRMDGTLLTDNPSLYFVNNGCTDAALLGTNDGLQTYLKSAGGPGRAVFQVTNAPTADAWRVAESTTSTVPVGANSLFQKNPTTGVCAAAAHVANFIVPLTPAQAPTVASGSLKVQDALTQN